MKQKAIQVTNILHDLTTLLYNTHINTIILYIYYTYILNYVIINTNSTNVLDQFNW